MGRGFAPERLQAGTRVALVTSGVYGKETGMMCRWFSKLAVAFMCWDPSPIVARDLQDDQAIEDECQYRQRMQDIDHSFEELVVEREQFWVDPDNQRNAARLTELFHNVELFWKGRGNHEAAGFARMAREGAEKAQEASRMRDEESFDAAVDTIARSCEGCHKEADAKFRIRR